MDIAGEELDTGQQAPDTAHVAVAVAAHPITDAIEDQRVFLKGLQRREALLEGEVLPHFIGPEGAWDNAIGREQHDKPLLALACRLRMCQRRQVGQKRKRRGAQAEVTEKISSCILHRAVIVPGRASPLVGFSR